MLNWSILIVVIIVGLPFSVNAEFSSPEVIVIKSGSFLMGSTEAEKERAYKLDEAAYGHSVTRNSRWYENEAPQAIHNLPEFSIMRYPVTNKQYQLFKNATGHPSPGVTLKEWDAYGLIHPYARAVKFIWVDGEPPEGRTDHPVVMVSHKSALAYANWLSKKTGNRWRLPREVEWEKAARGVDGRYFPWGNEFEASRLNSHDAGPFETVSTGQYPSGASPFGLEDAAGQVFEWTATRSGDSRYIVKGGSWDDKGCGICRPAARHSRPEYLKHILIGFRLITEGNN